MTTLWARSISVGLWLRLWSMCLMVSETVVTGYTCPVASPLWQTVTRKYNCYLLSVVSFQLIPFNSSPSSFHGFSQEVRHWRQPLWDHHLRWDSLLPPSCYSWRKKGVDQSSTDSVKKWKITGAVEQLWDICQPQLNLLIVNNRHFKCLLLRLL